MTVIDTVISPDDMQNWFDDDLPVHWVLLGQKLALCGTMPAGIDRPNEDATCERCIELMAELCGA